jgi:hypothetical protein
MPVTLPLAKCIDLQEQILQVLVHPRHQSTPKIIASIIGKIRSAARIAPWGNYLSQSSQDVLTAALCQAAHQAGWFWRQGKMRVPAEAVRDLFLVADALHHPEGDPTWTRPIALLIPHTGTQAFLSDASYGGLGGWLPEFTNMWQVVCDTLLLFGFPMNYIDTAGEPINFTNEDLHINPLEFIAIIINIWLNLKIIATCNNTEIFHQHGLHRDRTLSLKHPHL